MQCHHAPLSQCWLDGCLSMPETKSWSSSRGSSSSSQRQPNPTGQMRLWFLRQQFAPASLLSSLPTTSIPPHHSPLTQQPVHWQTVVWLGPDIRCTQRQALRHRSCQSNDTGREPLDVFGQEDEDFSSADSYLPCRRGWGLELGARAEAFSPALWLHYMASGWSLRPLICRCGAVPWQCGSGSGLISQWRRQIAETDFDNVKKEISFFFSSVYPGRLIRLLLWVLELQSGSISTALCLRRFT